MIDTLWLRCPDFSLSKDPDLVVEGSSVNPRTGECGRSFSLVMGGGEVDGISNAHQNVRDNEGNTLWSYNVNPSGVLVQLHSLPRIHSGGIEPTTAEQTRRVLGSVESGLADRGVNVRLFEAEPVRVDLFRNSQLRFSFGEFYLPLLSDCVVKGERRMQRAEYNGETFQVGNSQRACIFYDKGVQWQAKYHEKLPVNTLRAELKLLKKRPVFSALRVSNVSEVLDRWETLPGFYISSLKKLVFHRRPQLSMEVYKDTSRDLATLQRCRSVFSGRQSWQKTVQRYGYAYFASRYTASQFYELLLPLWGRFVARRAAGEVARARRELRLQDKQNYLDLFQELEQKLLKAS